MRLRSYFTCTSHQSASDDTITMHRRFNHPIARSMCACAKQREREKNREEKIKANKYVLHSGCWPCLFIWVYLWCYLRPCRTIIFVTSNDVRQTERDLEVYEVRIKKKKKQNTTAELFKFCFVTVFSTLELILCFVCRKRLKNVAFWRQWLQLHAIVNGRFRWAVDITNQSVKFKVHCLNIQTNWNRSTCAQFRPERTTLWSILLLLVLLRWLLIVLSTI